MSERLGLTTPQEIEAALVDLATAVAFPPTPDLAGAVGRRVREGRVARPSRRPILRSLPRSLLLAAAIALLVVGAVIGIRVGLDLLSIDFGPVPSPVPSSSTPATAGTERSPGAGLGLGEPATLDEAGGLVPFAVSMPTALGPPDAIYVGGADLRGQLSFVYGAGPGLPASGLLGGAGLLITQNEGSPDDVLAHKLVDARIAKVEAVRVDGAPGYWISGDPHFFWYLAPDGTAIEDTRRLVGDTLVWERDGILYRIEGAITKERALAIAASMD